MVVYFRSPDAPGGSGVINEKFRQGHGKKRKVKNRRVRKRRQSQVQILQLVASKHNSDNLPWMRNHVKRHFQITVAKTAVPTKKEIGICDIVRQFSVYAKRRNKLFISGNAQTRI